MISLLPLHQIYLAMASMQWSCTASATRSDCRRFGSKKTQGGSLCLVPSPTLCCRTATRTVDSRGRKNDRNLEILRIARENFIQEISFKTKDKDISLAKALLYVAAEDEAFMTFNRDMDALSFKNERKDDAVPFDAHLESDSVEVSLAGKSIPGWLNELDILAKEVEAELVSRDIGCHMVEVLEAVNVVLFELRGFKRFPIHVDSKFSYLHTVLSSGCGSGKALCFLRLILILQHQLDSINTCCHTTISDLLSNLLTAIMLSVIYLEICRRLGITMVGSCVGEDFLIWPQTGYPEELFKTSSGHSLFAIINGRCVEDPRSKASDLNSKSLQGLDIATKRDIIGIALANLIRLHWKRASRLNHGLMLTSPLRSVYTGTDNDNTGNSKVPLLRPRELRLATMASERLLILQPHNWVLRRDHGMLLYYNRSYGEAVQELSICMAFAPAEEAEILEPFVEKLHLVRLESSWKSLEQQPGPLTVP